MRAPWRLWLVGVPFILGLFAATLAVRRHLTAFPLARLTEPSWAIAGAYHVHSSRSHDSTVAPEAWAQAAKALGLDFVVLTDHNMEALPPQILEGVLVLFEREASTPLGHRVEWPGGSIAAHPTDTKRPWAVLQTPPAPLTGLEIASASATARRIGGPILLGLLPALTWAGVWPEAGLAQLYARDDGALELWDGPFGAGLGGLCSADAHGWLPPTQELALWRMVLPHVSRSRPLQLHQAQDIRDALSSGHGSCTSGLLPAAARVEVLGVGEDGQDVWAAGKPLHHKDVAALVARVPEAVSWLGNKGMRLRLLRDGAPVCSTTAAQCRLSHPAPGCYRAEVAFAIPQALWGSSEMPLMYSARVAVVAP